MSSLLPSSRTPWPWHIALALLVLTGTAARAQDTTPLHDSTTTDSSASDAAGGVATVSASTAKPAADSSVSSLFSPAIDTNAAGAAARAALPSLTTGITLTPEQLAAMQAVRTAFWPRMRDVLVARTITAAGTPGISIATSKPDSSLSVALTPVLVELKQAMLAILTPEQRLLYTANEARLKAAYVPPKRPARSSAATRFRTTTGTSAPPQQPDNPETPEPSGTESSTTTTSSAQPAQ